MLAPVTWDVYAIAAGGLRRLDDLPATYRPPIIGSHEAVAARIREIAPDVDASDPAWLRLAGPDHTVDISLGKGLDVREVIFYLDESAGGAAVGRVVELCRHLALRPFDTETGEVLTADTTRMQAPPMDAEELRESQKKPWWKLGR